jgi:hypothetical protein
MSEWNARRPGVTALAPGIASAVYRGTSVPRLVQGLAILARGLTEVPLAAPVVMTDREPQGVPRTQ